MKYSQALAVLAFVAAAVNSVAAVPVTLHRPAPQTVSIETVDSEPGDVWNAGKLWKRVEAHGYDADLSQSVNISFPYESHKGIFHLYSDDRNNIILTTDENVDLSGGFKEVFTVPKDTPSGKLILSIVEGPVPPIAIPDAHGAIGYPENIIIPLPSPNDDSCKILTDKDCIKELEKVWHVPTEAWRPLHVLPV